jgi:tetratricopeptide (TPR) repeat protein
MAHKRRLSLKRLNAFIREARRRKLHLVPATYFPSGGLVFSAASFLGEGLPRRFIWASIALLFLLSVLFEWRFNIVHWEVVPTRPLLGFSRSSQSVSLPAARSRWSPLAAAALISVSLVLLVASSAFAYTRLREPPTVLVLPFSTAGEIGKIDGYGLAVAVRSGLATIPNVRVKLVPNPEDVVGVEPAELGRDQGAEYVVTGRIEGFGSGTDSARVHVEVIRSRTGRRMRQETFSRMQSNLSSYADVENRIVRAVVQVVRPWLVTFAGAPVLVTPETRNAAARRNYLEGRLLFERRSPAALRLAVQRFNEAIKTDSIYAQAYAALADTHVLLGYWNFTDDPGAEFEAADRNARRALDLDPALAEAHASAGLVRLFRDIDIRAARDELQEAVKLSPSYAPARQWLADVLTIEGDRVAALEQIREAVKIDRSIAIASAYAQVLFNLEDYESAKEQARKTIAMRPNCRIEGEVEAPLMRVRVLLSRAHAARSEHRAARETIERALDQCVGRPPTVPGQRCRLRGAENELTRAAVIAPGAPLEADSLVSCVLETYQKLPAYHLALYYATRGKVAEARAWLDSACTRRERYVVYAGADPAFDLLPADTMRLIQNECGRR